MSNKLLDQNQYKTIETLSLWFIKSLSNHSQITLKSLSNHSQITLKPHSNHTQTTLKPHSNHTQIMKKHFAPIPYLTVFLLLLLTFPVSAQNLSLDAEGWTVFNPSTDSRIIYVSSTDGNDATAVTYTAAQVGTPFNPTTTIKPYKTVAEARKQLRDNHPDWILFKRGDVWYEQLITNFKHSGKSVDQPMLFGAYGDINLDRPMFKTGEASLLTTAANSPSTSGNNFSNFVAFVSLHGYAQERNPDDPEYIGSKNTGSFGCNWARRSDSILFEDMKFDFYTTNLIFQTSWTTNELAIKNLTIRRCVITDAYMEGAHRQGMFINDSEHVLIEENVIDYNGWREDMSHTLHERQLGHNIYAQYQNGPGTFTVRNNIITRGSSHGVQLRCGGILNGNYFARNPLHSFNRGDFFPCINNDNVYQENVDIVASNGETPRGLALELFDLHPDYEHECKRNIISNDLSGEYNSFAIKVSDYSAALIGQPETDYKQDWPSYAYNLTVEDNIVYNHRRGLYFLSDTSDGITVKNNIIQNPDFDNTVAEQTSSSNHSNMIFSGNKYFSGAAANRSFRRDRTFMNFNQWTNAVGDSGSVFEQVTFPDPGRTSAEYAASLGFNRSFEAFIEEARKQRKGNWRTEFTSFNINNYIREGYGMDTGNESIAVTGVEFNVHQTNITIASQESVKLLPIISPSNATNQSITWSSSDTSIVKVDSNGLVTTVSPGEAIITATTVDGNFTATSNLTVTSANSDISYRDIVYKTTNNRDVSLRAYYPGSWKASDRRPVMLLFHGGSWVTGHRFQMYKWAKYFAARGIVAISASYTYGTVSSCVIDTRSAMRWVKANASTLGIDPNKVIAGGSSAGAHLAGSLYSIDGINDPNDDLSISTKPNILVFLDPAINLNRTQINDLTTEWSQTIANEAQFYTNGIDQNTPPTIYFCGSDDERSNLAHMSRQLSIPYNIESEFWVGKEGRHGFADEEVFFDPIAYRLDKFLIKHGMLTGTPTTQVEIPELYEHFIAGEKTNLIQPASVVYSTAETSTSPAINLINGTGFLDNPAVQKTAHSNEESDMWKSNAGITAEVGFDLGTNQDLSEIHLWNWSDDNPSLRYGVKKIEVLVSSDTDYDTANFTLADSIVVFRSGDYAQNYKIEEPNVRLVKFNIYESQSSNGSIGAVGFAEIRFSGDHISTTIDVTDVSLNQNNLNLNIQETSNLTETVSPANATNTSVVWSSSNTAVATVDSNGLITAITEGIATITVTTNDGAFTDSCEVTINATIDPNVINFNAHTISSYDDQDVAGTHEVLDGGATIRLTGNSWKKIDFEYPVTKNTVIELEMKAPVRGEIQGVGLDENDDFNNSAANGNFEKRVFDLYGTQNLPAIINESESGLSYTGSGDYELITISVGQYYTGQMNYFVIANDHDINPASADLYVKNVKIYEKPVIPLNVINFDTHTITSYDDQDVAGTHEVLDDGTAIRLTGNSWKKIDFEYPVTENTVIELEMKAPVRGEIQGVGLDENDDFNNRAANGNFEKRVFDLYGTQNLPAIINESESGLSYKGSGDYELITIPVGQYYTGQMNYFVIANDHDINPASADLYIKNVKIYEKSTIASLSIDQNKPIIYPNPISNQEVLNIFLNSFIGSTVRIIDLKGTIVYFDRPKTNHIIIESEKILQPGSYIISISVPKGKSFSNKLIVK